MKTKNIFLICIPIVFCIIGILTAFMPVFVNIEKSSVIQAQAFQEQNTLNGMTIDQITSMPKFDGRDYGIVTPVKDQGSSNICWAYSTVNAAESSILRTGIDSTVTDKTLAISPEYMAQSVFMRSNDPLGNAPGIQMSGNWFTSPGDFLHNADVLSQWAAPIKKGETAASTTFYTKSAYRLTDALEYNFTLGTDASYIIPYAKKAIAQYGAIVSKYNNVRETMYYNPKNETSSGTPHAITIIGWDDTISKDLFKPSGAKRDGGWIVKNSYNSLPYFYLSYDCNIATFMALQFANMQEYQYNYFYDSMGTKTDSSGIGGNSLFRQKRLANVFQAKKGGSNGMDEYIKAVNVHFSQRNTHCKVEVYTNLSDPQNPASGTLAATETETFEFGGYRTVKLKQPVKITNGSYFAIVVDVSGSSASSARVTCALQNNSYGYYQSYGSWKKITMEAVPRIKAYTVLQQADSNEKNIANADVQLEYDSIEYAPMGRTPNVTVSYNNALLTKNDYEVKYANNKTIGTADVIIEGKNQYTGRKVVNFTIVKANQPPKPMEQLQARPNTSLKDYALPENFIWSLGDTVLNSSLTTIQVMYVGSDKECYKNTVITIPVVYSAEPNIPKPPIDTGGDNAEADKDNSNSNGGTILPPSDNTGGNGTTNAGNETINSTTSTTQSSTKNAIFLWTSIGVVGGLVILGGVTLIFKFKK